MPKTITGAKFVKKEPISDLIVVQSGAIPQQVCPCDCYRLCHLHSLQREVELAQRGQQKDSNWKFLATEDQRLQPK